MQFWRWRIELKSKDGGWVMDIQQIKNSLRVENIDWEKEYLKLNISLQPLFIENHFKTVKKINSTACYIPNLFYQCEFIDWRNPDCLCCLLAKIIPHNT